jgi:uncharacterized membrane protein
MKRLTVLLIAAILCAPAAYAEEKKDDDWMKGRLFAPEVILANRAALKLSDAQRDVLRKELVALQGKAAEIDFEMLDSALEIQSMLDKHPVDSKAALAEVDTLLAAENRKKRLYLEALINIKNMLTPAQVQIARELPTGDQ